MQCGLTCVDANKHGFDTVLFERKKEKNPYSWCGAPLLVLSIENVLPNTLAKIICAVMPSSTRRRMRPAQFLSFSSGEMKSDTLLSLQWNPFFNLCSGRRFGAPSLCFKPASENHSDVTVKTVSPFHLCVVSLEQCPPTHCTVLLSLVPLPYLPTLLYSYLI